MYFSAKRGAPIPLRLYKESNVGAPLWEYSAWLRAKVTKIPGASKMPASTLDADIPCALSRVDGIVFGVHAVGKVCAGAVRVAIMVARACGFIKSWFEREKNISAEV